MRVSNFGHFLASRIDGRLICGLTCTRVYDSVSIVRRFDSPKIQLKLKLALTLTLTLTDTGGGVLTLTDTGDLRTI